MLSEHKNTVSKYKSTSQSTKVLSQSTKVHFWSTKVFSPSTKVYFPISTKVCYPSTKICFPSTKAYFQSTIVCHPSLSGSSEKKTNPILRDTNYLASPTCTKAAEHSHPPPGHKLLCADATDHAFAASAWHTTRRCCCRYSVRGFNCSGAKESGCAARHVGPRTVEAFFKR